MFLILKVETIDNYSVTIVLQFKLFFLDIKIIFTFVLTWNLKMEKYPGRVLIK